METTSTYRGSYKNQGKTQQGGRHGEDLLKTTGEGIGEIAQAVGNEAGAQFSSAVETARATYAKLQDKGVECAKATDRMVREHPYPSVGLAFGVGVLIGLLCHRRN